MVPTHERLDAGDAIGLEVDDGLVPDDELVVRERAPELALYREPVLLGDVEPRGEHDDAVAPCCFACCVAMPASRMRPVVPPGLRATPMLAVTTTSCPVSCTGGFRLSRSRSA